MRNLKLHKYFSALRYLGYPLVRQGIGSFVAWIPRVPAHPTPLHFVLCHQSIQRLPQVGITHRLLVSGEPATPLPVGQPFAHALLHVLRIRMDDHMAGSLQCPQCLDTTSEFHTIVGCLGLAATQLLLVPAMAQQCPPASGPGVALAGTVRPDFHWFTTHFIHLRSFD